MNEPSGHGTVAERAPPVAVKPLVWPVRLKPVICLPLPALSTGVAVTVVVPGWEMIRCPTADAAEPLSRTSCSRR